MIFYLPMVNAWSLAYDTLNGTLDEEYPIVNHQFKYHEEEILKDIEEYISSTYNGHYTGTVSYTHLTLPTTSSV